MALSWKLTNRSASATVTQITGKMTRVVGPVIDVGVCVTMEHMENKVAPQVSADPLAALRLLLDETPDDSPVIPLSEHECDALSDDTIVCQCNNVSAGEIREMIATRSCADLHEVQVLTRAGAGCGNCLSKVAGLVDVGLSRLDS